MKLKNVIIAALIIIALLIFLIPQISSKAVVEYKVEDLREPFMVPLAISNATRIKEEDYKELVDALNSIRVKEEIGVSTSLSPLLINLHPSENGSVLLGDDFTVSLGGKWYKANPKTLAKIYEFCKKYGFTFEEN